MLRSNQEVLPVHTDIWMTVATMATLCIAARTVGRIRMDTAVWSPGRRPPLIPVICTRTMPVPLLVVTSLTTKICRTFATCLPYKRWSCKVKLCPDAYHPWSAILKRATRSSAKAKYNAIFNHQVLMRSMFCVFHAQCFCESHCGLMHTQTFNRNVKWANIQRKAMWSVTETNAAPFGVQFYPEWSVLVPLSSIGKHGQGKANTQLSISFPDLHSNIATWSPTSVHCRQLTRAQVNISERSTKWF